MNVNLSSRAIAISAYEDRFDVMIMGESISRTHFDPIVGVSTYSRLLGGIVLIGVRRTIERIDRGGRHYLAHGVFAHGIKFA